MTCQKRRVRQHDWKTTQENNECLTCSVFMEMINNTAKVLTSESKARGMGYEIVIQLVKENYLISSNKL